MTVEQLIYVIRREMLYFEGVMDSLNAPRIENHIHSLMRNLREFEKEHGLKKITAFPEELAKKEQLQQEQD